MSVWTWIAQIGNFIVFVVVLYFLLYRPVGRILKERKDAMEADLRKAEKLRAEAEQALAQAQKREQELEAKREGILKEAREQADKHRKEVLKETEDQARARVERFRRVLKQERDDLLEKITGELRTTILHVAGAVVGDDAGRLADRGIERVEALLQDMSSEDLERARNTLDRQGRPARVRSAAPLNEDQQNRLKKILGGKLGIEGIELEVEEDPSLVAGLEVALGHINLSAHWQSVIDDALSAQKDALREKQAPSRNKENGPEKGE